MPEKVGTTEMVGRGSTAIGGPHGTGGVMTVGMHGGVTMKGFLRLRLGRALRRVHGTAGCPMPRSGRYSGFTFQSLPGQQLSMDSFRTSVNVPHVS